jgi:hypothetical protein
MDDTKRCQYCGSVPADDADNIVPFQNPRAAGPPQVDVIDVGDGRVRLTINLVVRRETAVRVLSNLGETD